MRKIDFIKALDAKLGSCLVRTLPAARRQSLGAATLRSALVIRPGGIGDAVLLAPAIAALRNRFPGIVIDILAEKRNAAVFEMIPGLHEVFAYDRPSGLATVLLRKYDLVIDTEQWYRLSAVISRLVRSRVKIGFATNERARMFDRAVGYDLERYEMYGFLDLLEPIGGRDAGVMMPGLVTSVAARQKADDLLRSIGGQPFLVLFAGASIPEKRWPASSFQELIDWCLAEGLAVVMVGDAGEAAATEAIVAGRQVINLVGRTSLVETAAILGKASCLVSGDSGVLHIAAGFGCPTVALFGPSSIAKWAPQGAKHVALIKADCSPCSRYGNTPDCPHDIRCMREIAVADVRASISQLVNLPTGKRLPRE